ncbi:acetyl esterase/lipase [Chitinophaga skermanii]|uniref:Acetyl esterase/lipase n=1 Tax=Chitinophaga skermanii TaxID=331697 RepID=A0A327QT20_9BACT|nr:alpha/beta hydrolase [Chitinophaga skermanii]RAJ06563.1 acetyl esterase/lipase [Chitinophaga skermanii]
MRNWIYIICLFSCTNQLQAQIYPRDTSFTIAATLQKELKKFPFISVATEKLAANIVCYPNLTYATTQHRSLTADIFAPTLRSEYPAVVLIHGGGWRSGDKTQMHTMATTLAKNGFVGICVEYRLSPEAAFPAGVRDIKRCIRWVKSRAKEFRIDTSKMTVLGCSSGGQMAALIATTNFDPFFDDRLLLGMPSSHIQAAIDIDGILAFKHPLSAEGAVAAQWLGGTYEEKPANWVLASPLTHVNQHTAPTLFINSDMPRFHAGRDEYMDTLHRYHIPTEAITLNGTPHTFWFFHPWYNDVMQYVMRFLRNTFQLKN